MEETGKKGMEGTVKNWKKAEETGRNACKSIVHANKVVEGSFQILRSRPNNIGTSMQICISQNSGILQGSIDLLSNDYMF